MIDVVDDVTESGMTLSEAFGKHPQVFRPAVRQHGEGR